MLTPFFELSQNDDEVILLIRAPLANVSNTEITVEEDTIVFYSSPYYLRLHLPGKIIEEDDKGKYDCDKQEFSFYFTKVNKGEHFPDLDMVGKLLIPKKKHQIKPLIEDCSCIEVVPSSDPESDDDSLGYIKQEVTSINSSSSSKYGFANKGQGIGNNLSYEFSEILDFVDFENTTVADRTLLREADEQTKFCEEYYLADFMEADDEVNGLVNWKSTWEERLEKEEKLKFSKEEFEILKTLGNRDYLLDDGEKKIVLLSLVDILFAFAYNHRTTLGEYNVESAWTINKLSATLSWLQSFQAMKEVKVACVRRSLVYPLYRNWNLSMATLKDTAAILKLGRRQILKCLLEIYKMFSASEPRYLLNELYIIDYCIWIQKVSDKKIRKLLESFEQEVITKEDVGLDLEELEAAAYMVQEESELEIINKLKDVKLDENEKDDTSGSSDAESTTSETSASTSLDSDDLSSPGE